ncbi:MAG: hypothetical protein U0175_39555 [Caldilineaceae bacterium]
MSGLYTRSRVGVKYPLAHLVHGGPRPSRQRPPADPPGPESGQHRGAPGLEADAMVVVLGAGLLVGWRN